MNMTKRTVGAFAAVTWTCCAPLHAHHSSSLFETTTPIVIRGVIADVYFGNPHSAIFIDAMDDEGHSLRWAIENSSTLAMTRKRGLDEAKLQPGAAIAVCGYAPKNAAPRDAARPATPWWRDADRAITGRLLMLESGPEEHWSHYGPLEPCQALLAPQ